MKGRRWIEEIFAHLGALHSPHPQPSRQFSRKLPPAGFLPEEGRDGGEGDRVLTAIYMDYFRLGEVSPYLML